MEREINKDGIPMLDTGENSEAPPPREMFDLEVFYIHHLSGVRDWGVSPEISNFHVERPEFWPLLHIYNIPGFFSKPDKMAIRKVTYTHTLSASLGLSRNFWSRVQTSLMSKKFKASSLKWYLTCRVSCITIPEFS